MTEPDIPKWLREYAYEFELATLDRAADEIEHLRGEIDRLARHILANGFDEPSRNEGAVDVAIRLLGQSRSAIPGARVSHSVITPTCRMNRGDDGAFDEAVGRARAAYRSTVAGWAEQGEQPTIHLALTMERP